MKIHFHLNEIKPGLKKCKDDLVEKAGRLGISEAAAEEADIVVVLGGDGTFLRAVHLYPGVPVLGFKKGGLGYLSSVGDGEFEMALKMLAAGKYRISERGLLEVRKPGDRSTSHIALNDIVAMRELSGHSALLELLADGKPVARYMSDGLIFSTPTGSTAYSLAAGGPVLMPDSGCVVVTPMNPHALGVRPLVVNDSVRFTLTARRRTAGNSMKVGIYADGVGVLSIEEGESVEISKSGEIAKLIELEGYDPYGVLARKLGWSGCNL